MYCLETSGSQPVGPRKHIFWMRHGSVAKLKLCSSNENKCMVGVPKTTGNMFSYGHDPQVENH